VRDLEPQQLTRHEVQRQLDLVKSIGSVTENIKMSVRCSSAAKKYMCQLIESMNMDFERPWVVIHPGATAPSRRYPGEQFAAAARSLIVKLGCQIIFTGSSDEIPLIETIRAQIGFPTFTLAGDLDLQKLIALISISPLLITNNTGPAHIASAVGTPVVDLYALTNPQHTPWQVPSRILFHDVPCKFCYKSVCPQQHHNCLRLVRPEAVVEAAAELLQERFDTCALAECKTDLPVPERKKSNVISFIRN
jgi:ADP-heptose:LPS heptosyltransferase